MSEFTDPNRAKFLLLVGNDVASRISIGGTPLSPRMIAAWRSNPTIVEVDPDSPVEVGWTWDGENFNPPA